MASGGLTNLHATECECDRMEDETDTVRWGPPGLKPLSE